MFISFCLSSRTGRAAFLSATVRVVALGMMALLAGGTRVLAQAEAPALMRYAALSGPVAQLPAALRQISLSELGTGDPTKTLAVPSSSATRLSLTPGDSELGPRRSRGELLARGALIGTGIGALAGAGTYLVLSRRSTSRDRSEDPLGYLLWSIDGAAAGLLVGLVAGALSGR